MAGSWARGFLEPLLQDASFNTNRTLVVLTFDETEKYNTPNRVFTVLLGGAVPAAKRGTKDGTRYSHYSLLSTVEHNWGLGHLTAQDANATSFAP